MGDGTGISWADATWNPVTGCTKVSEGCLHCYIERTPPFRMAGRRFDRPGIGGTIGVQLHPERLDQPMRWRKPRRIFVNSLADLYHDAVPDEFVIEVFTHMWWAPQHIFQVLTKRPARMRALMPTIEQALRQREQDLTLVDCPTPLVWPLPNVWLGVSAETQEWANIRVPQLVQTPAAVRFVSAEPLLGPLDLSRWLRPLPDCGHVDQADGCCLHPAAVTPECPPRVACPLTDRWRGLDWVIVGGESGPGACPMHPGWVRDIRDQCQMVGVPLHLKQWGEWLPVPVIDAPEFVGGQAYKSPRGGQAAAPPLGFQGRTHRRLDEHTVALRVGKKTAGRVLDDRTWEEFPSHRRDHQPVPDAVGKRRPISTLTGQPCNHPPDRQCVECVGEGQAHVQLLTPESHAAT